MNPSRKTNKQIEAEMTRSVAAHALELWKLPPSSIVWKNPEPGANEFYYNDSAIGPTPYGQARRIYPDVLVFSPEESHRYSIAVELKHAKHYTAPLFALGQAVQYLRAFDEVYIGSEFSLKEMTSGYQYGALSLQVLDHLGIGYLYIKKTAHGEYEPEIQHKAKRNKCDWWDATAYDSVWAKVFEELGISKPLGS